MFKVVVNFNRNTNINASCNKEQNLAFIRHVERYVNDVFKIRGYIYLNIIYDHLGLEWDPNWNNICRIYQNGDYIRFLVTEVEDGFRIFIE